MNHPPDDVDCYQRAPNFIKTKQLRGLSIPKIFVDRRVKVIKSCLNFSFVGIFNACFALINSRFCLIFGEFSSIIQITVQFDIPGGDYGKLKMEIEFLVLLTEICCESRRLLIRSHGKKTRIINNFWCNLTRFKNRKSFSIARVGDSCVTFIEIRTYFVWSLPVHMILLTLIDLHKFFYRVFNMKLA